MNMNIRRAYPILGRYYDPTEGRFVSKDQIGFAGGDRNLYAYVKSNPINFTDPSGLRPLTDCEKKAFSYVYDAKGKLTSIVGPDGKKIQAPQDN